MLIMVRVVEYLYENIHDCWKLANNAANMLILCEAAFHLWLQHDELV